jgi:hypothetical protein
VLAKPSHTWAAVSTILFLIFDFSMGMGMGQSLPATSCLLATLKHANNVKRLLLCQSVDGNGAGWASADDGDPLYGWKQRGSARHFFCNTVQSALLNIASRSGVDVGLRIPLSKEKDDVQV